MSGCQKGPQLSGGDQRMAQQKSQIPKAAYWTFMNSSFHKKVSGCVNEMESSRSSLLLQDSSGLKLWKRRWFVLSNYCLFYYKGTLRFTIVHRCLFCTRQVYIFIVPHQTVERKRSWAASPFPAIKSCSAHLENARTGSSHSRYTCA